MCSSQTGRTVDLPNVVLKRLSDEDIQHQLSQFQVKKKRTQSRDRQVKKVIMSSRGKKKKNNVKLLSAKLSNSNSNLKEPRSLAGISRLRSGTRSTMNSSLTHGVSSTTKSVEEEPLIEEVTHNIAIKSYFNDGHESDEYDTDDDITVIDNIVKDWYKIVSNSIKREKDTDSDEHKLKRTKTIENLIDENKTLTIPLKESQTSTTSSENKSNKTKVLNTDSEKSKTIESQSIAEAESTSLIKLKSPLSLGVSNNIKNSVENYCSTKLKKIDHLKMDDSIVANICLLYCRYFNPYVNTLICCLMKSLEAMLMELTNNDTLKDFIQNTYNANINFPTKLSCGNRLTADCSTENLELDNPSHDMETDSTDVQLVFEKKDDLFEDKLIIDNVLLYLTSNIEVLNREEFKSTLKHYSKDFVQTFTMIVDKFDEEHKKIMIPIVYLYVLKRFENSSTIKRQCLWNIILKIFEIENFSCKYDGVREKLWKESKKVFSIYERWLQNFLTESNVSEKLINSQNQVNFREKSLIDTDVKTKIEKSNDESNLLLEFPSPEMYDTGNISQTGNLAVDKCVELIENIPGKVLEDKNNSHEESCKEICQSICRFNSQDRSNRFEENEVLICNDKERETELKMSGIFEYHMDDAAQNCVNHLCTKKMNVPCFFCNKIVCCENLCQINEDQIWNVIPSEKTFLVACEFHKYVINNYNYYEESGEHEIGCVSGSCKRKMSVPCIYCMEPTACLDMCKVDEEQSLINIETQETMYVLISCKAHRDVPQNFGEVENEYCSIYYDSFCWGFRCGKMPFIVCTCKTRCYCSRNCQETDWTNCHYYNCPRLPPPHLIL